ncbi:MAG: hypothetical protein FJY75_09990 [Candidatus Eisenbacteria bacterium]|uniref:KaiC-like domain-containing protein n=1 Tax=Eiseniibacteriota bacterium TaxID=2212470 RepID=A0A938BMM0_UNCEI|nr:hypothetical protein [Candidatus Eisenbacteria bacterium]
MELRPTGITGFDAATGGGLPAGGRTLLYGPPGAGKTVFALQCLWTGLQAGETVACTASDRPFAHLRRYSAGFGWELAPYEESGQLLALQSFPRTGEEPLEPGVRYLDEADLGEWRAAGAWLRERGAKRLLFGEYSQACFGLLTPERAQAAGRWLAEWAYRNEVVALEAVTAAQLDPEGHKGWSLSLKATQAVIQFRVEGGRRSLRIPKLEGATHPLEWVTIEIGARGIEMGVA